MKIESSEPSFPRETQYNNGTSGYFTSVFEMGTGGTNPLGPLYVRINLGFIKVTVVIISFSFQVLPDNFQ
jgi:hypothetical protein